MSLTLVKLKEEGRLQTGDLLHTPRLGQVELANIESTHTITVKDQRGKFFRITGLSFGADTRMVSKPRAN